jgi:hypothetical protein
VLIFFGFNLTFSQFVLGAEGMPRPYRDYWIYRHAHLTGFAVASQHTKIAIGATNTAILLKTSFLGAVLTGLTFRARHRSALHSAALLLSLRRCRLDIPCPATAREDIVMRWHPPRALLAAWLALLMLPALTVTSCRSVISTASLR